MSLRSFWVGIVTVVGVMAAQVLAVPPLQVDIKGGTYNADEDIEDMIASGDVFSLYALANPANGQLDQDTILSNTFYLSIAVTPSNTTAGNYGSFTINGTVIDVTDDMLFGTPLVNTQELPSHGKFDTFYTLIDFTFDPNDKAPLYNTEDIVGPSPGPVPDANPNNNTMYFKEFAIDTSNLSDEIGLHFDLFTVSGNQLIKAPFSHDASTGERGDDDDDDDDDGETPPPPDGAVPEPVSAALGALALAGLGMAVRRRR